MLGCLLCLQAGCTRLGGDDPFADGGLRDALPLGPTLAALEDNVFAPRCHVCHYGPNASAAGMDFSMGVRVVTVEVPAMGSLCSGGAAGWVRIAPGDPEASLLYRKVKARGDPTAAPCGDSMPQGAALSAAEVEAIRQWIADGAPEN